MNRKLNYTIYAGIIFLISISIHTCISIQKKGTVQLLVWLAGCQSNTPEIDLSDTDIVSIADFTDSIFVIQLETTEQCLIGNIDYVTRMGDQYYICDYRQHTVFCFNRTGKYLFKIDHHGRGPDEYPYLGYFAVDPYNNRLLLLVPAGELLTYDLSGNFIEKIRLSSDISAYNEVFPLNKDSLLFTSTGEYKLVLYSGKQNIVLEKSEKREEYYHTIFDPLERCYLWNDSLFYADGLSGIILNLSDKNKKEHFRWNFGKNNNTDQMIENTKSFIMTQKEKNTGDPIPLSTLLDKKKLLHHYFWFNTESARYRAALITEMENRTVLALYDKCTKTTRIFNRTTEGISPYYFWNSQSIILFHINQTLPDGQPYCIYAPTQLTVEQRGKIQAHNESRDNPILVEYILKKP